MWSALYGLILGLVAYEEWQGADLPLTSAGNDGQLLGTLLFWYALIAVTAWLTRLLTRHLETGVLVSSGKADTWGAVLDQDLVPEELLRQVFGRVAQQLRTAEATLWMVGEDGRARLLFRARDGKVEGADSEAVALPAGDPIWNRLRVDGTAFAVQSESDSRRTLHVPLLRSGALVGRLTIVPEDNNQFGAEEIPAIQGLAQQITLATYMGELNQRAQQGAVLEERNRMAREIHDTLAQGITGVLMQLEATEDALQEEPREAVYHLDRARGLARDSLQEARRSVRALRPLALERASLRDALEQMVETIRDVHRGRKRIPPEIATRLAERMLTQELTPREMDVLRLIMTGMSNREIGQELSITEGTVKSHVNNLLGKLGVKDRTQAVTEALRRGLVRL